MHQVRLAEPDAAVDEQRVVGARGCLGDGAAGGVRELVGRADDEGVERVAGIQAGRPVIGAGTRVGGLVAVHPAGDGSGPAAAGASLRRRTLSTTPASTDFRKGLGQHDRVVLGQPVPEERVRHPDGQPPAAIGDERGGLEPGVEAVPVDLGLDAGEDLFPDASLSMPSRSNAQNAWIRTFASERRGVTGLAVRHTRAKRRQTGHSTAFRRAEIPETSRLSVAISSKAPGFPQLFPQLWKTWLRNPVAVAHGARIPRRRSSTPPRDASKRGRCHSAFAAGVSR